MNAPFFLQVYLIRNMRINSFYKVAETRTMKVRFDGIVAVSDHAPGCRMQRIQLAWKLSFSAFCE